MYLLLFMLSFNAVSLAMEINLKRPQASPPTSPMDVRQDLIRKSQKNHKDRCIEIESTIQSLLGGELKLPSTQSETRFIKYMLHELEYEPGVNDGKWYGSEELLKGVIIDTAASYYEEEADIVFEITKEIEVRPFITSLVAEGVLKMWLIDFQRDQVRHILEKLKNKPGISADASRELKWRGTKEELKNLILEASASWGQKK